MHGGKESPRHPENAKHFHEVGKEKLLETKFPEPRKPRFRWLDQKKIGASPLKKMPSAELSSMQKLISQGAEAKLYLENGKVRKHRFKKSYRIAELDDMLRGTRTRREAKILEKLSAIHFPAPKLIGTDNKELIILEYIQGKLIKDILKKENAKKLGAEIGEKVAILHNQGIIHGDLTTSNMILRKEKKEVYFIDFGLSFTSLKEEDKAVDLHVLKEALESKHHTIWKECYDAAIGAYRKRAEKSAAILKRLETVEKRGRYRAKKGG